MANFSNDESIEEFKQRLNSLTEKLNNTTKNLNQTPEKIGRLPKQLSPRLQATGGEQFG
jgi:prefoldin subunit 5